MPHSLILENRKNMTLTGVSDVDSFDEQAVIALSLIHILIMNLSMR